MRTALVRSPLLVLGAALAASVCSGQQKEGSLRLAETPHDRPYYTAFPDLKPPTYERKKIEKPDGKVEFVVETKGAVPLLQLPALAADASPLRRLQYDQVQAGLAYLYRVNRVLNGPIQGPAPDYKQLINMNVVTYRLAAELEDTPEKRVPWYEARVRALKEIEKYSETRVQIGTTPPQDWDFVRFERLGAEADLLKLKAEVEKAKK